MEVEEHGGHARKELTGDGDLGAVEFHHINVVLVVHWTPLAQVKVVLMDL